MRLEPMAPPIRCHAHVPMPLSFAVVPLPLLLLPWTPAVVVPPPVHCGNDGGCGHTCRYL